MVEYTPKTPGNAILEELPEADFAPESIQEVPLETFLQDTAPADPSAPEKTESPPPQKVVSEKKPRVQKQNPLILRLTRRAVFFFGLETLALILYYVSGNQQHFLEFNIKIILWGMTVSTIALALFCAAGLAESLYYTFSWKQPRFLLRIIPYAIIFASSVAFVIFSRTVDLLSVGF